MKSKKKIVLAGLALLAITMVLLPLSGCKTEVEPVHTHTFGDWEAEDTETAVKKVVEVCAECGYAQEVTGFVYISAGTFKMGSTAGYSDEQPEHEVTIRKGYFMGQYEVTQQLYRAVMKEWGGTRKPSDTYGVGACRPKRCFEK